jgi:nitrogen fixation NifU-like protein
MYQERILDHYKRPRNFGHLESADLVGEESNPLCGDHIQLELALDPARTTVTDVRFSGDGCAISMASASLLTGRLKGHSLQEISQLQREDVEGMLGIPLSPMRVKCALTSFKALGKALAGLGARAVPSPPEKAQPSASEGGTSS